MTATIITITSGKAASQTTTTANLALALAELGDKVVCIDGDIGLRNLDVVMGLETASSMIWWTLLKADAGCGRR